jgi:hypothetical protein
VVRRGPEAVLGLVPRSSGPAVPRQPQSRDVTGLNVCCTGRHAALFLVLLADVEPSVPEREF